MKKEDNAKLCLEIIEKMSPALKKAKIGVKTLVKRLQHPEKYTYLHIADILDFLNHKLDGARVAYDYAWGLVTPETWTNYNLLGLKNLREQNILEAAIKQLKLTWKKLPKYVKANHGKKQKRKKKSRTNK